MKKRWILLIVPLLMALMMNAASASELLGNVLSLVLNSPDDAVLADDCRADAEDARIIIASGAHYQLIAAAKQENGWESAVVSTNAVYQPSEGYGVPTLTRTEDGFELAYPEAGEVYRFALRHDSTNHPIYTLVFAKMGDIVVTKRENFGYLVTQGEDGAVWSKMVTLADFNIHQMPRGTADVRRMNEMACGLQRFANVRKDGVKEIRQEWRRVPIQTVCGTYLTDDPHVSEAHQEELPAGTKLTALGYCGWAQLGKHGDEWTADLVRVPMLTAYATYLTDDPNVSEYHQAELPAGTKLTALSHPSGWAYIYVEATVDGKITRGFVPQRDVVFDDVELPDEEAKIVGSWQFDGGSEIWYWYLRLDADGRFYTSDIAGAQPYHGTWSVVQTLEDSNLYWSGKARVPTIVLRCTDGMTYRYGMAFDDEVEIADGVFCKSLSFLNSEGGGGFSPYGTYDEYGNLDVDENGNLNVKQLDITDEKFPYSYWYRGQEEGNG